MLCSLFEYFTGDYYGVNVHIIVNYQQVGIIAFLNASLIDTQQLSRSPSGHFHRILKGNAKPHRFFNTLPQSGRTAG